VRFGNDPGGSFQSRMGSSENGRMPIPLDWSQTMEVVGGDGSQVTNK
jgi:hypothetical protein